MKAYIMLAWYFNVIEPIQRLRKKWILSKCKRAKAYLLKHDLLYGQNAAKAELTRQNKEFLENGSGCIEDKPTLAKVKKEMGIPEPDIDWVHEEH